MDPVKGQQVPNVSEMGATTKSDFDVTAEIEEINWAQPPAIP